MKKQLVAALSTIALSTSLLATAPLQSNNTAQTITAQAKAKAKTTTKSYKYVEHTGVSKITSTVKVTRNSKGIVKKVKASSVQTGVSFPIGYKYKNFSYKLNKNKKGGTAYVRGYKLYGATVAGQEIKYKKPVTYKIKF
ncbi:hypothetical protein [Kurthia senegalensis]|uniref:hypothetical protein n=1 Tax=Kurthia senegalensis TaxID=1033740 RepID=UPI000289D1B9|nr:hypothetical protein [Kurthia senegalensis]